ncbi:MAG: hypothetical protein Ta2E_11460 [Mycoplasmoidaceae bacterium]|nr:MAG: hypothetical protein Ta2E_11460 [Mycoplasmoidaceae bacterium]
MDLIILNPPEIDSDCKKRNTRATNPRHKIRIGKEETEIQWGYINPNILIIKYDGKWPIYQMIKKWN